MEALRTLQSRDDLRSDALRATGGLLFGIAALVLILRRTGLEDPWGDFAIFLVWLIPALVLYVGGIMSARVAEPRMWHSVWVVLGIIFVYGTLRQFLELIDGDQEAPLNTVWTSLVVAVVALGAAVFARVRFGWLVAGIALVVAWLALWDEILTNGVGDDAGTFRGLCMIATLGLVAASWALTKRGTQRSEAANEVMTAAGLTFVLGAGLVGLAGLGNVFVSTDVVSPTSGGVEPSLFWDLVLLGGSIGFIAIGSFERVRGPVYAGALGIGTFILLVGFDLDDDSPAGKVVGWPLILLVAALLAIAASIALTRTSVGDQNQAP